MISIIFAPPRTGKTCFLTHILIQHAFDRDRTMAMQREIRLKKDGGFPLSIPQHTVSANYDVVLRKFGYQPRKARRINPFRLGFENPYVKTHFNVPYEVIGISEAQKYLNSRMSAYYPDWQSRWYEQHGHNNLDIYLDVQRPGLIDVNIRELAQFIEIVKLKMHYDDFGKPDQLRWTIRKIDNSGLYERYIASGKTDKSCYVESDVVADYNVFDCYNSQSCKPFFYAGHFNEDFDYRTSDLPKESVDAYVKYLKENDDELPDNFYRRKVK